MLELAQNILNIPIYSPQFLTVGKINCIWIYCSSQFYLRPKIFVKKFGQTEFSVDPELQLAYKYKYIIEKSINQLLQLL